MPLLLIVISDVTLTLIFFRTYVYVCDVCDMCWIEKL